MAPQCLVGSERCIGNGDQAGTEQPARPPGQRPPEPPLPPVPEALELAAPVLPRLPIAWLEPNVQLVTVTEPEASAARHPRQNYPVPPAVFPETVQPTKLTDPLLEKTPPPWALLELLTALLLRMATLLRVRLPPLL